MKIVVHPAYRAFTGFIEQLPTLFDTSGETLYEGRNILKIYRLPGNTPVVVKRFRIPLLVNRIRYALLGESKASRSYHNALKILEKGISTPAPVAYMEEKKYGLPAYCYYLSFYERETETVRSYMGGHTAGNEQVLAAFTRFTVAMHEAGVVHLDYSPGNILRRTNTGTGDTFTLVDINRLTFSSLTEDGAYHNLQRLCLSKEASTWIAREYARERGYDETRAVAAVNRYSDRFFAHKICSFARKDIRKQCRNIFPHYLRLFLYASLRFIRTAGGMKPQGYLYNREKALYFTYIAPCDLRKVWLPDYLEIAEKD
ncbi:MAG: lipopolysaccharide kinase InaA family protein [Tannerellaceae bacterium]|jgi:tRNA A-37 threonylcarbamoyl transferase component Bud32|nr:lipopolysaccharide kinase InaA family protein [Tannerellaceae bacterium]